MNDSELIERADRGRILRQPDTYGASVDGVPLRYWASEQPDPTTLVVAALHGDEPDTTVVLSEALRSTPVGRLATDVVLAANPDGLLLGTRGNSRGVDLNRNFPTTDWSPAGAIYRWGRDTPRDVRLSTGTEPRSEPEVGALIELIEERCPRTILVLHTPLACIDDPTRSTLGRWISEQTALPLVPGVGYETPGSIGTWGLEHDRSVITYEFGHEPLAEQSRIHYPVLVQLLLGTWAKLAPLRTAVTPAAS